MKPLAQLSINAYVTPADVIACMKAVSRQAKINDLHIFELASLKACFHLTVFSAKAQKAHEHLEKVLSKYASANR